MKEKKARVEDALHAVRAAVKKVLFPAVEWPLFEPFRPWKTQTQRG